MSRTELAVRAPSLATLKLAQARSLLEAHDLDARLVDLFLEEPHGA